MRNIDEFLDLIPSAKPIRDNKRIGYYNLPAAFDIESSSFYDAEGQKTAVMYGWTFGIAGEVLLGRTWEEFLHLCDLLIERMELAPDQRLVVYVHNLAFEFQFLRKLFHWSNVFALDLRKPVRALTEEGIEFRCSYLLSGYGLAKLGEQLQKYPVQKMVGDLDYKLLRHSGTPLTEKEEGYMINDARVVMAYAQECIENDGDITRIPMTKTGYVRAYCRKNALYGPKTRGNKQYHKYHELMLGMQLTPEEYAQLKRAFMGGFTHASAWYSGKTLEHIHSYDFTSSYPYVMCSEMFPMSSAEPVTIRSKDELYRNMALYCCLFDVEIFGLESRVWFEHPLSASRCYGMERVLEDNGRIVSADHLYTTWTEQDWWVMTKFYSWDKIRIYNFKRYKKSFLPTDFVKSILKLYKDKTELKGVEGKEIEYLHGKEMLNSCYGMTVTDICRDEYLYSADDTWSAVPADIAGSIAKYNRQANRFLFYPWGVWVTAYARKNLFTGILEFREDYVYSDTDSLKVMHAEDHRQYIARYNYVAGKKLERAMQFHGIPVEATRPMTIKGKEKPLGVWDDEGEYSRFRTLGAKRYLTEKDGVIEMTVAGLNKHTAMPYMLQAFPDPFEAFSEDLYIPPEYTGKNTHTYIDEARAGVIRDYTGQEAAYFEASGVHLEEADYSLSLSRAYADYLLQIKTKEV